MVYHLTDRHLESLLFVPRIPESANPENEDTTLPRICFSSSIGGCLSAIGPGKNHLNEWPVFSVYIPEKPLSSYKHMLTKEIVSGGLVIDAHLTDEVWILEPVKLVKVGAVEIHGATSAIISGRGDLIRVPEYEFEYKPEFSMTSF